MSTPFQCTKKKRQEVASPKSQVASRKAEPLATCVATSDYRLAPRASRLAPRDLRLVTRDLRLATCDSRLTGASAARPRLRRRSRRPSPQIPPNAIGRLRSILIPTILPHSTAVGRKSAVARCAARQKPASDTTRRELTPVAERPAAAASPVAAAAEVRRRPARGRPSRFATAAPIPESRTKAWLVATVSRYAAASGFLNTSASAEPLSPKRCPAMRFAAVALVEHSWASTRRPAWDSVDTRAAHPAAAA